MNTARAGDRGVMLDLGDVSFDELHAAAEVVRALPGVSACVVGHSSLLVIDGSRDAIRASVESLRIAQRARGREHRLTVGFAEADAPDLPLLLDKSGLSLDRLFAELRALRLRARYLGFLAGFAYLEGIPDGWALPRRPTSRSRVAAGSFAIGGEMAAFYPVDSPGGWNILGRTDATLWDVDDDPPNRIAAGDEVTLDPTRERVALPSAKLVARAGGEPVATVLRPGQRTLLVAARDLRRYEFGLSPGGPFDVEAARCANRAVGNPDGAVVMECAYVGPELRVHEERVLSWCGATSELPTQFAVPKGGVVRVGRLRNGVRGYLAIDGGWIDPGPRWAVVPTLLMPDTLLQSRRSSSTHARIGTLARGSLGAIRALLGPHPISEAQRRLLEEAEWEVMSASDRVGVRFRATKTDATAEMPTMMRSCGAQFGTVQWHADGSLVAMGPDHPVTGGYLQPMTIPSAELWKLAQVAPGARVRWEVV